MHGTPCRTHLSHSAVRGTTVKLPTRRYLHSCTEYHGHAHALSTPHGSSFTDQIPPPREIIPPRQPPVACLWRRPLPPLAPLATESSRRLDVWIGSHCKQAQLRMGVGLPPRRHECRRARATRGGRHQRRWRRCRHCSRHRTRRLRRAPQEAWATHRRAWRRRLRSWMLHGHSRSGGARGGGGT